MAVHHREARVNDGQLRWVETGPEDGPVLLLVHGFPFNSRMWRPQIEEPPPGWRLVAPDLRGFGGSGPAQDERLGMDVLAADLAALLRHLGTAEAVVAGLSMGGYVAFALLDREPGLLRALVLSDTRAAADTEEARATRLETAEAVRGAGTPALTDGMIPKLLSEETRRERPGVEQEVRSLMEAAPAASVSAALLGMAERADSTALLGSIRVPTLVIAGEEDQLTPPEDARALAREIPGAELELVAGAGHLPNLERPDVFNRVLGAFLSGLS